MRGIPTLLGLTLPQVCSVRLFPQVSPEGAPGPMLSVGDAPVPRGPARANRLWVGDRWTRNWAGTARPPHVYPEMWSLVNDKEQGRGQGRCRVALDAESAHANCRKPWGAVRPCGNSLQGDSSWRPKRAPESFGVLWWALPPVGLLPAMIP